MATTDRHWEGDCSQHWVHTKDHPYCYKCYLGHDQCPDADEQLVVEVDRNKHHYCRCMAVNS